MRKLQINWLIFLSLLVATLFMLVPLPDWAVKSRPDLITLVLMYWWLAHPEKVGVFIGFLMGILLDVMYGSLLGQQAFGITIAAWIFVKKHQTIRVLPVVQQALIVFLVLFMKQFFIFWVDNARGYNTGNVLLYFSPSIVGGLIWPWLFVMLRDLRRRFSGTA